MLFASSVTCHAINLEPDPAFFSYSKLPLFSMGLLDMQGMQDRVLNILLSVALPFWNYTGVT